MAVDQPLEPLKNLLKIQLLHQRMGLPSFSTLKIFVIVLFQKVSLDTLKYGVCEYSKHARVSFQMQGERSEIHFFQIHSDI